jgi:D-alanyl-D-alanine carboxypeptidase
VSADNSEFSETLQQCWARLGIPIELIVDRGLPVFREAHTLEVAETGADGRQHYLVPEAAAAWSVMKAAALTDAVNIHIVSAHRSVARQTEIVGRKLEAGQTLEQIFAVSAPPGCSEHHTGRAVDIGTPEAPALETDFELTPAWNWLQAHAAGFGFTLTYPEGNRWGYSYEPWHWCFRETPVES